MKRTLALTILMLATVCCEIRAEDTPPTRVICVGNSITYGARLEPNRGTDSYPDEPQ